MTKKQNYDLNETTNITLGQAFILIKKLKFKTIAALITMLVSVFGLFFTIGRYSHSKETAVLLEVPFSMRIETGDDIYTFDNLTLVKDPTLPIIDKKVVLSLREIQSEFDIVPIGSIVAAVEDSKLTGIWGVLFSYSPQLINEAQAGDFNWNGHQSDFNFKEEFINKQTVYRTYQDGCILAYDVDNNRKSAHGTFRWIKRAH